MRTRDTRIVTVALALACAPVACRRPADAPRAEEGGGATAALHLRDVTEASGVDFTLTSGRTPSTQILEVKGAGLALLDVDGDGDHDLLAPNGATLDAPDAGPGARLYRNDGGLRFTDATEDAGLEFRRWGFGCAVGDVEGDGDDDVAVACFGENALLRNDGGRLADRAAEAGVAGKADAWSTAACFGDVDRDGDLDLYFANFLRFDPAAPPPPMEFAGVEVFGGPMGLEPQADVLYENRGDGTFVDVSLAMGIRAVEPGYGLGVAILDFDLDGRPEIFVGNDSGPNHLFWRRDDGPFRDRGLASGIATNAEGGQQATMGIAIGDVSGNGLPDVYTTNFMNDTNTLHVNDGDLFFEDRTQRYGLGIGSRPYLGWAAMFVDLDHDADEDLLVFNGHVYPEEITEPHRWGFRQTPLLYERDGERFVAATAERAGAWLGERHRDRTAVFGDLDRDGDVDVVVGGVNEKLRVLENDGAAGSWLVVRLHDPTAKNPRGLGARVTATFGDRTLVRWVHTAGSYQASNAPEAHFGLGDHEGPVTLEVTWPDGATQTAEANARTTADVAREAG